MTDGRRLAVVRDYAGLHEVLRQRAEELDVSRETIDAVTGLQPGYSGKVLAPEPIKSLGKVSLGPMLQGLGLALVVVEDEEGLKRLQNRLVRRKRHDRTSDAGSEKESEEIDDRRERRLRRAWAQMMNRRRNAKLTGEQRRRLARKAGRASGRARRRRRSRNVVRSQPLSDHEPEQLGDRLAGVVLPRRNALRLA